jgi:hypothetical protein
MNPCNVTRLSHRAAGSEDGERLFVVVVEGNERLSRPRVTSTRRGGRRLHSAVEAGARLR